MCPIVIHKLVTMDRHVSNTRPTPLTCVAPKDAMNVVQWELKLKFPSDILTKKCLNTNPPTILN